jgi:S-formylglutathione hydrolase FrmB
VISPSSVPAGQKLQVVYLLHGGGGGFRDWSNYSDVARFAETGLLLVMPEGDSSYYTNSAYAAQDRYEDYIVQDLISDVEGKFTLATGRANRAIVGISMGGFGAVKLALRYPERFVFVGGISPAIDVPRRSFTMKRLQQSRHFNAIFGSSGSKTRHDNDPFVFDPDCESRGGSIFFSDVRRAGRSAARKSRIRFATRAASFSIRVPHGSRPSRLEPVECMAAQPVSKPCGPNASQSLIIGQS